MMAVLVAMVTEIINKRKSLGWGDFVIGDLNIKEI